MTPHAERGEMKRKDVPATFDQGVVCAASYLVSMHGEDSLAIMMLKDLVGLDAVNKADEYDKRILARLVREERKDMRFAAIKEST